MSTVSPPRIESLHVRNYRVLKAKLEAAAREAGLTTRTQPGSDGAFQVVNRIAVEELEAWFFGDVEALREAYPRIPAALDKKETFRDPDAISGGTWERLEKLLVAYHPGGLEKVRAAREIARHMEPTRNRSRSFQVFRHAILEVIAP